MALSRRPHNSKESAQQISTQVRHAGIPNNQSQSFVWLESAAQLTAVLAIRGKEKVDGKGRMSMVVRKWRKVATSHGLEPRKVAVVRLNGVSLQCEIAKQRGARAEISARLRKAPEKKVNRRLKQTLVLWQAVSWMEQIEGRTLQTVSSGEVKCWERRWGFSSSFFLERMKRLLLHVRRKTMHGIGWPSAKDEVCGDQWVVWYTETKLCRIRLVSVGFHEHDYLECHII